MDLTKISNYDFQKLLKDKVVEAMASNGSKQKLFSMNETEKLLSDGVLAQ